MSYSDKYRGTEWDQSLDEPPVDEAARGTGGSPLLGWLISFVVLALVVAGIAGAGWYLTHDRSRPAALPRRTSSESAVPRATITPSSVALSRFVDLATRNPPLPMRVEFHASIRMGGFWRDVSGTVNAAGDDAAGEITISERGARRITVQVVDIGGRGFARGPGESWRHASRAEVNTPTFLFQKIRADKLDDLGLRWKQNRQLYLFRAREWPGPDLIGTLPRGSTAAITRRSYEIYVTDLGVPVYVHAEMDVDATQEGQRAAIQLVVSYEISRFSKPVRIVAPAT
jgi:hypothetical protein